MKRSRTLVISALLASLGPLVGNGLWAGALVVVAASLPTTDDVTATLLGVAAVTALPVTVGAAVVRHHLLDQRADVEGLNRRVNALSASRRHIVNEREVQRAVSEVRRICDGLRPAALKELGLAGALTEGIEPSSTSARGSRSPSTTSRRSPPRSRWPRSGS